VAEHRREDFCRPRGRIRRAAAIAVAALPALVALAALLGLAGRTASAVGAGPRLAPLHGRQAEVPPGATPVGPEPASSVLPLTITLQPRDPAALAAQVRAVSDPTSPEYHRFLTPAQFARRYGPDPSTIASVTTSLRSQGLTVGPPSATGLSVPVSGTAAQEEAAFATPIERYRLASGATGHRNVKVPELPVSVAPAVQGILGLDTLSPPRPTASLPTARSGAAGPAAAATPALAAGQPSPTAGSCSSSIGGVQSSYGALDAPQLAQAYSFDPLYGSGDYGAGSTIALVEMYGAGYSTSDITTFANCYGISLSNGQVSPKSVLGGPNTPGDGTVETELDIEAALSMAPKASIKVYEGGASAGIYDVFNQIVSDDTARIVSASWTNGCEAYVGSMLQSSENTLFQAAALEGQSVFVAAGDQGSQGCNVNAAAKAPTGSNPVAQVADTTSGTLYVANKSSNSVTVDSEGSAGDPASAQLAASVTAGTGPDAIALDSTDGKVFVANGSGSTLTTFVTATCKQGSTTGCGSPTQIPSNGHLSNPTALALYGTTLYVANSNGTVAVYDASSNTYKTTVTLPLLSSPTSLAVDQVNGITYVGDAGLVSRVDYFDATTCNATVLTGCSTTPATVSVGQDPVSMVVENASGSLYVANAGSGGGVSVISLSSHTLTTTISTSGAGIAGTGLVQSVALSPDGSKVLAALDGLTFPGDVLATIDPSTQAITATVDLQTGNDTMGALAVDSSRDDVWLTDESSLPAGDIVQNLNLAVTDPASQPLVTSVGGTSVSSLGPAPTETTWNDNRHYAEGAGGGGISGTFAMPAYQQALGAVAGSSGTPCGNGGGDCREVPDVSADADPSTGYVIYDSVNGLGWTAIGGTSGAAPLWAAVLAVAASADSNTAGYGAMNPILYTLAQQSPGTYLNDVTTGNNDYNGTGAGQFAAANGYDMATGLGSPVTSALATGLSQIPLNVAVSGSQTFGGTPTFSATASVAGSAGTPYGVSMNAAGLVCTQVAPGTAISTSMPIGTDTLVASSCTGVTLSGVDAALYRVVYTAASGDYAVTTAPLTVSVSGSQTYGGSPTFSDIVTPPTGVTVDTSNLQCTQVQPSATITSSLAVGSHTLVASSCSGALLGGPNVADYTISYTAASGDFTVAPAPLTVTASSSSMNYGSAPPTISAGYSGFVNGQNQTALTAAPTCTTAATSTSSVSGSPYVSTCSGAVDPNYAITYVAGSVTVTPAPLTITASSPTMTYGSAPPAITPLYSGFKNGDTASSLTTQPTCSATATNTSPPSPPTYPSSCTGAAGANYTVVEVAGATTVMPAPVDVAVAGSQAYGGTPSFTGLPPGVLPSGITGVDTNGIHCTQVAPATSITSTLGGGSYTLVPSSCRGATLSGPASADYAVAYTAAGGDFTVRGGPPPPPPPAQHGYWLVGSDGGIFTFGSATFHGSTGSLALQRPVVGITPRADDNGYWLVASDGGIFAFNTGFYGSIPGLGLHPYGSGIAPSLNAPIVGMVPSADGGGYFMIASDGGVFAFGDAQFEGSCPGIGGCNGTAVAVVPDASGRGYWLVTQTGNVYTFGDAPYYGAPGPQPSPITAAVRSADGHGYYILLADGSVDGYGDARPLGGPVGAVGGFNPASAIFTDSGGGGYWVASAGGGVFTYGDAPNDGSMAGTHLNGAIIAGTGF
jgi:Pro-kumamolisin, activation domain/MBG domain (YGX type)